MLYRFTSSGLLLWDLEYAGCLYSTSSWARRLSTMPWTISRTSVRSLHPSRRVMSDSLSITSNSSMRIGGCNLMLAVRLTCLRIQAHGKGQSKQGELCGASSWNSVYVKPAIIALPFCTDPHRFDGPLLAAASERLRALYLKRRRRRCGRRERDRERERACENAVHGWMSHP